MATMGMHMKALWAYGAYGGSGGIRWKNGGGTLVHVRPAYRANPAYRGAYEERGGSICPLSPSQPFSAPPILGTPTDTCDDMVYIVPNYCYFF